MRSSEKSVKQILGSIETHLREQVSTRRLKELGWWDFRNLDRPDAGDVIMLACDAFVYLSTDSETGNWNQVLGVLIAITAYLTGAAGYTPRASELVQLQQLLQYQPVQAQLVCEWFRNVYS